MITKKIYSTLQKYEQAFTYATKGNCIPAFSKSEIDEMEVIYNSLGCKLQSRKCGHCLLTMVQKLAKEYYEYGEKSNSKGNKEQKVQQGSNTQSEVGSEEEPDSK